MRRPPGSLAGGEIHIHVSEPRKPASEVDYGDPLTWAEDPEARPWLDRRGHLVIPMNCPMRWRWWHGGQSVSQTMRELT